MVGGIQQASGGAQNLVVNAMLGVAGGNLDDFGRLASAYNGLDDLTKAASRGSTTLGTLGIVATVADAAVNGLKPHHYADRQLE